MQRKSHHCYKNQVDECQKRNNEESKLKTIQNIISLIQKVKRMKSKLQIIKDIIVNEGSTEDKDQKYATPGGAENDEIRKGCTGTHMKQFYLCKLYSGMQVLILVLTVPVIYVIYIDLCVLSVSS